MNLHEETVFFVKEESRFTSLVINNLQKNFDTGLYLEMGYANLYQYCIKALGYSEHCAYRRLAVVEMAREFPEIKEKLDGGSLNLTTLSMAHSLISSATPEKKREIIKEMENCSKREVKEILATHFPTKVKPKVFKIYFR